MNKKGKRREREREKGTVDGKTKPGGLQES